MKLNKVIALIRTESIPEVNIVLRKALRTDLGQLNRMKRNALQSEGTVSKLERKYRIVEKGIDVVHEEVQQRLVAIGAKLERYDNRTEQYRQNRLFESNQKKLFEELDGVERETVVPDAEESTRFWSDIWDKPIGGYKTTYIEVTKLKKQVRKLPNWKSPEPDGVQGYWIKNLSNLHGSIVHQLDRCLQENHVPVWMVTGKTVLCERIGERKRSQGRRDGGCGGILAEELYEHLEQANILPWEQKGYRKGSRGTKDQLLIDKMTMRNCKKRLTSLAVAWIAYSKAYDKVLHTIDSRAVSIVRYGAGIIKWTKNELEELDRKTRELMTIYGAHHPKADVDRLYLNKCDGGRGLIGGEDCVQAEVNSLDKYLGASEENMLKEVSLSSTLENNK
ncbi:uncharacterized protein LOC134783877 [Penaeus indicus]|uniref:uncharacterized protein LOC134783877 n=1 Tax=Penaeus indicus TaxID=29960 RepID=UPI00300DAD18